MYKISKGTITKNILKNIKEVKYEELYDIDTQTLNNIIKNEIIIIYCFVKQLSWE